MRLQFPFPTGLLLAACALAGCDRGSRAPHKTQTTAGTAAPPAPTNPAAASTPVSTSASPMSVPTPAATALALARAKAAATAGAASAGPTGPCARLRGAELDACIDAQARASANPVAVDEDANREFRDAQARRDRDLMDRDEEEARVAAAQADFRDNGDDQPPADPRDDPRDDLRDYPRDDPRDAAGADDPPDDPPYDGPYDDGSNDPPPDDPDVIDEGPPPDDPYLRR